MEHGETVSLLPQAFVETATAAGDWVLILPVVLGLMGAALLLMLRGTRYRHPVIASLVTLAIIACDVELLRRTLADGPLAMTMGRWLPPFGISFTADAMSASFALTAGIVTLMALLYVERQRDEGNRRDAFAPLVLLLLAGVSGAFLTGDLFNLYVWFEVMLIASFGLMVLGGEPIQLDATLKYGFLNFLATTFFLIALGLLYGVLGTLNMADIALVAPQADEAVLASITGMFLFAFGIKAAAFPVNAWLPASYHAPSAAVSALLAGLLTKVGAYALLRVLLALLPGSREVFDPVLAVAAIATLVLGPLGAIAETNLRRALGFILIGGIGAILAGLALGNATGVAGAAFYILHAMLTMAALYLVAGLIEATTGETDTRQMGGLYAASSGTAILFLVLILAVAGVPPFLGFWPKVLLVQASLEASIGVGSPDAPDLLLLAALLANALLTLIAGARLWSHIFWRAGPEGPGSEFPNARLRTFSRRETLFGFGSSAFLAAIVLAAGLWPGPFADIGISAAATLLDPGRYIAAVGLGGTQ